MQVKLGSHSDVGYSSMTEVQGVGEEAEQVEKVSDGKDGRRDLERQRSYSIVKPPQERKISGEEEVLEEGDETIVAEETGERLSVQEVWEAGAQERPRLSYTDIRNKFPNLLPNTSKDTVKGPVRALFPRQDSQESHLSERVRDYVEGSTSSRGGSEARDLSEARTGSEDSLEVLESLPESPDKGVRRQLPTLVEIPPADADKLGALHLDKSLTALEDLDKSLSSSNSRLNKTPVTLNDPLGALSSQTSPMDTPSKEKSVSTKKESTF